MERSPIMSSILKPRKPELYGPGGTYAQEASEVHETCYLDGAVTLNERTPLADGDHARVFWPAGEKWVDAIPRAATPDEVEEAVTHSLREWF